MSMRVKIEVQTILSNEVFAKARANGAPYVGANRVDYDGTYDIGDSASVFQALRSAAKDSGREWTAVAEIVYVAGDNVTPVWRSSLPEEVLQSKLNGMRLHDGGVFALRVLDSS